MRVSIKHVGIRPKGELRVLSDDKKVMVYVETLDDGSYRKWTKKQLNSGCGAILANVQQKDGLIHCPQCDEWFSKNQFEIQDIFS